jgi:hypothetical protein
MDDRWEWTDSRAKLAAQMLEALEAPYKILNAWEQEFLENVTDQFNRNGRLSERQYQVLERIHTEKA